MTNLCSICRLGNVTHILSKHKKWTKHDFHFLFPLFLPVEPFISRSEPLNMKDFLFVFCINNIFSLLFTLVCLWNCTTDSKSKYLRFRSIFRYQQYSKLAYGLWRFSVNETRLSDAESTECWDFQHKVFIVEIRLKVFWK